jgi:hypothetical protein
MILIIYSGLQSLPKEPFEAIALDGASRWQTFRYLTLPMLRPVILVGLLFRVIDAYKAFDVIWIITRGGPGRVTENLSVFTYKTGFREWNVGYGTGKPPVRGDAGGLQAGRGIVRGGSAARRRFLIRRAAGADGEVLPYLLVDKALHSGELIRLQRLDVGEVEAQALRRHERAGLTGVRAKHPAQGGMKEVGARMIARRVAALLSVYLGDHVVVDGDAPLDDAPAVEDEAALGALRIPHLEATGGAADLADVADLAAGLGVERRLEQHDLRLVALLRAVDRPAAGDDAGDSGLMAAGLIPHEAGLDVGEGGVGLRRLGLAEAEAGGGAGALPLRVHLPLEPLQVNLDALLGSDPAIQAVATDL